MTLVNYCNQFFNFFITSFGLILFRQILSRQFLLSSSLQGAHETFGINVLTSLPHGFQIFALVGPKMTKLGTPKAAARWLMPESFPKKTLTLLIIAARVKRESCSNKIIFLFPKKDNISSATFLSAGPMIKPGLH